MPRKHTGAAGAYVALVALLLVLMTFLAPAAARGEEVFTTQAAVAHAEDSTWIPAPAQRASLCIVDTGNDVNPDTSNVIARFAIDGGTTGDLHPDHHGTLMSMIASAPHNGFGMVGAAPSINVVSVRASRDGTTFGSLDLTAAIQTCLTYRKIYNIKVISLSLGGRVDHGFDSASISAAQDAVDRARRVDINVLGAAGNQPGPVDWPAAYEGVLAVGAADANGEQCSFSASGASVAVWATGCPQDVSLTDGRAAWASGTSEATAFVAAVLTQIRGLRPALSATAVEALLADTARPVAAGPMLTIDALFGAIALGDVLNEGHRARPSTSAIQPSGNALAVPSLAPASRPSESLISGEQSPPSAPRSLTTAIQRVAPKLPRPRVRSLIVRRGALTLRLANKPKDVQTRIQVFTRVRRGTFPKVERTITSSRDRVRTRLLGIVSQVSMIYLDPTGRRDQSPMASARPRR